jgi:DNA mismatch repair ATPase MutS
VKKFIVPLTEAKNNMKGFEELIEATIDVEAAKDGEYTVSPKFDPLLEEIHDQRVSVKKQLDKHESSVRSDLDNPGSFKREMDKQYGWIFKCVGLPNPSLCGLVADAVICRLGKKDEKLLQPAAMKKKYEVIGSIKSGVKFRDAKLRSLSDNYRELTERYDAASSEVVREIMNVARSYFIRSCEPITCELLTTGIHA